jgi:DNA-binding NtrC family response regulator
VPALRERKEDIPLLVRHLVQQFSQRNNRMIDTIPSEIREALVRYHWPGNIRELQNVIERAVIISKGPVLNVSVAELEPDVMAKSSPAKVSSVHHKAFRRRWTRRKELRSCARLKRRIASLADRRGSCAPRNQAYYISRSHAEAGYSGVTHSD